MTNLVNNMLKHIYFNFENSSHAKHTNERSCVGHIALTSRVVGSIPKGAIHAKSA